MWNCSCCQAGATDAVRSSPLIGSVCASDLSLSVHEYWLAIARRTNLLNMGVLSWLQWSIHHSFLLCFLSVYPSVGRLRCLTSWLFQKCCACPNAEDRALKPTTDGRWIHVSCAFWNSEPRFVDSDAREPVSLEQPWSAGREKLVCDPTPRPPPPTDPFRSRRLPSSFSLMYLFPLLSPSPSVRPSFHDTHPPVRLSFRRGLRLLFFPSAVVCAGRRACVCNAPLRGVAPRTTVLVACFLCLCSCSCSHRLSLQFPAHCDGVSNSNFATERTVMTCTSTCFVLSTQKR